MTNQALLEQPSTSSYLFGFDEFAFDTGAQDKSEHPMALLLEEFDDADLINEPQSGEIRQGVVMDKRAKEILEKWSVERKRFVKVFPTEYRRALKELYVDAKSKTAA